MSDIYPRPSEAIPLLAERGLFAFSEPAIATLAEFVSQREAVGETPYGLASELLALTAAEFALEPVLAHPRRVLPPTEAIAVDVRDVNIAIVKCNCLSLTGCLGPSSGKALTLADVTAFSGDISKLAQAGVSTTELSDRIGDVARSVDSLERWQGDDTAPTHAREVAASGVLRLQGFLWAVKLSLPYIVLRQAVDDAYEALELMRPTGSYEEVPV